VQTLIDWLQTCAHMLTSVCEADAQRAAAAAARFPSLTQVIEWVCLCVDAHFHALMALTATTSDGADHNAAGSTGHGDVSSHLRALQSLTSAQLALGDKMHAVASLARQLLHSGAAHALPKQAIPVYSIEVFEM